MRHALATIVAGLALAGAACGEAGEVKPPPGRSTDQPRPQSGDVAIREELDAARRERTAAAYDRFIARHLNHPLAAAARKERAELAR